MSEQVHLRETHVDIERRAVDRPLRGDEKPSSDDTVEMVEMADEPVVSKQARVVEEVIVRKHVEDRTATISDKVRSTEIEFGKLRAFDAEEYRSHFESQKLGGAFDSYLPAYQFGHELHQAAGRPTAGKTSSPTPASDGKSDNPGYVGEVPRVEAGHAWTHARGELGPSSPRAERRASRRGSIGTKRTAPRSSSRGRAAFCDQHEHLHAVRGADG